MRFHRFFAIPFIFILVTCTYSFAAVKAGEYSLTLSGGYQAFDAKNNLKNAPFGALSFGLAFNKYVESELTFAYALTKNTSESNAETNHYRPQLDLLFHIPSSINIHPYFALGGGVNIFTTGATGKEGFVNYGGGLQWELTEHVDIKLDARHQIALIKTADNEAHNNLIGSLGLSFRFGGKEELPVYAEAVRNPDDEDNDGILNDTDRCPKTPEWMPVNSIGCPKDSDMDSIFDFEDECPLTEANMNVDMKGCPVSRVERQRKEIPKPLNLSIEFDSGSTQIDPKYHDLLDKAADMIKGHPDKLVTIEGHTDSIGSETINMKISHKRSDAVKNYLVKKHNILSTKINSVGFGELRPIAENSTPEGRFKNRRISIVFSNVKG